MGRKSWLFAGSDRGGERAAIMLTLIQTARLNDVDGARRAELDGSRPCASNWIAPEHDYEHRGE